MLALVEILGKTDLTKHPDKLIKGTFSVLRNEAFVVTIVQHCECLRDVTEPCVVITKNVSTDRLLL